MSYSSYGSDIYVPTSSPPGTTGTATSDPAPHWRIEASRADTDPAFLDPERFRRSTFILVAHDARRSARDLLTAYKTQQVVEQDNALVKGPLGIAPLFLKDTKKSTRTAMWSTSPCWCGTVCKP